MTISLQAISIVVRSLHGGVTIGNKCSRASPVSEPTARLMHSWMMSWKTLEHDVHSSTTIPNMEVRVITTLARVA